MSHETPIDDVCPCPNLMTCDSQVSCANKREKFMPTSFPYQVSQVYARRRKGSYNATNEVGRETFAAQ